MGEAFNLFYSKDESGDFDKERHILDVFHPQEQKNTPVIIFIHGGTWISGSKDLYAELGKNLARYGITAVLINYRLATDIRIMAGDCAKAVKWVYQNIKLYNGNKQKIFLLGHSAGGHLASLISLNSDYFDALNLSNPVKGCMLLDAFGLNIGAYIAVHGATYMHYIAKVFSNNPVIWNNASPVNYVADSKIPFLVFTGGETYPFVKSDNNIFTDKLNSLRKKVVTEEIPEKTHMKMVTQMRDFENPIYKKILDFIGLT